MIKTNRKHAWRRIAAAALGSALLMPFVGCQVEYAGQTLPSPYYLTDDVQYYAPGPEFKLAREAAAIQEQNEATRSEAERAGN
jgi:hypothetical protein